MKSLTVLFITVFPLFSNPEAPREKTAFNGLPVAAPVIMLFSRAFPSFPLPEVAVEYKIIPLAGFVPEPLILQYSMVLFSAEAINRMVDVAAALEMLVLEMVRSVGPD
jgi:hypothetical protein